MTPKQTRDAELVFMSKFSKVSTSTVASMLVETAADDLNSLIEN